MVRKFNGLSAVWALVATIVLIALSSVSADAHRLNESYVYFSVSDTELTGRFEANTADLAQIFSLDADGDKDISEAELKQQSSEVFTFFAERLKLWNGEQLLGLEAAGLTILETDQADFAQIGFRVTGVDRVPDELEIAYRPLADTLNPTHLGYGLIENSTRTGVSDNEGHIALIFNPGAEKQVLYLNGEPSWKVFYEFIIHGVWHIWLGFDHVIFLITLLLPSVMWLGSQREWVPLETFRPAFFNVVKLVTVFTVSHTITLSLAALGIVTLPVDFVETIIALSIAVVALMNMFPIFHHRVLWVVFVFGLFHGFGFANVLEPLGVDPSAKVVGLAAFNIGVELGQIAIVVVMFPILWLLRNWSLYPPLAFKLGSVCLILLAGVWFVERSTGMVWALRASVLQTFGLA